MPRSGSARSGGSRDMLSELVEQDHRQQLGPDEAARRGMEGRRRLGDGLHVRHENLRAPSGSPSTAAARPQASAVTSSPSFDSLAEPQRGGFVRRQSRPARAQQILGEGLADQPPAREGPSTSASFGRFSAASSSSVADASSSSSCSSSWSSSRPCAPSAGRRAGAATSRSPASDERSALHYLDRFCHGVGRLGQRAAAASACWTGGAARHQHRLGWSADRREERPTPWSRDNRITASRRLKDKTSTHRAGRHFSWG